jgi:hypothetical protein
MALLWADSFQGYATAQLIYRYYVAAGGITIGTGGRNGYNCLKFDDDSEPVVVYLTTTKTTICAGFAIKRSQVYDTVDRTLFALYENATLHTDIRFELSTGRLKATRNGTVLGITTNPATPLNVWAHIQIKIVVNDAAGAVLIKVNDQTVLNLTGVDTQNGGTGAVNQVKLYGIASGTTYISDYWIDDADLLGDCRIECIMPGGAGDTTAWTPSAGANRECVDEIGPDGDTSYVSSATVDQIDTYEFGNLVPASGLVKGVMASVWARKDDAGVRQMAIVARPGSTDRIGDTITLADTYTYYRQLWDLNPDTSGEWSIAEVNASEFGIKMVA